MDQTKKKIRKLWIIPSNKEVLKIPSTYDQIKRVDLPGLYTLEIDSKTKKLLPNYLRNNQEKILKERNPCLKLVDPSEIEQYAKKRMRFVEFKNAFTYEYIAPHNGGIQSPNLLSILKYFKNVQSLFDLEIFQNKISSHAHTVATMEKFVLSGLAFWEDGDEALFG